LDDLGEDLFLEDVEEAHSEDNMEEVHSEDQKVKIEMSMDDHLLKCGELRRDFLSVTIA
jgi:hypothetical protein